MIRHIVALRFRSDVTEAMRQDFFAALRGLSGHIDGIADFQTRKNVSVELPLVRGFNDVFWFDFLTAAVRDAYLADAAHQKIGARIVTALEGGADGVQVIDVEL